MTHRINLEDIESYDPDGAYFGHVHVTDSCDYDGGSWYNCSSAYSEPLNENLNACSVL